MTPTTILSCACGQVELSLAGEPILASTCYCDDCQAGARMVEALPGAAPIMGPDGGTPYVLYRKDRVARNKGAELLSDVKLRPNSSTNRVVATCCNTPMLVTFDRGPHWVSLYRGRFAGTAPPVEMLVNTRFAPAGAVLPAGIPAYATFPFRFIVKLVAARIAMFLPDRTAKHG